MSEVACPKCGSSVPLADAEAGRVRCGFCNTAFEVEPPEPAPVVFMPPKHDVCLALLELGTVRVMLDPRRSGVVIPPQFRANVSLALDIGLNLPVPIRDLTVDEDGIACTLSFSRVPFYCVMPWSSIFGLIGPDDQAAIWREDAPRELLASLPNAPPPRPAPRLTLVKDPPKPVEEAPKAAKKTAKKSAKKAAEVAEPQQAGRPSSPAEPQQVTEAKPAAKKSAKKAASKGDASAPSANPPAKAAPLKVAEAPKAAPASPKPAAVSPKAAPAPSKIDAGKPSGKRELPSYLRVVK